jgi:hypothetical protein
MLAAWLFALTAGVANACVLSAPSAATHGLVAKGHASHEVTDGEHHDHGQLAHQGHKQDTTAHDSCLKFCDDESSALSKANTSALDAGLALTAVAQWPLALVPITNVGTGVSSQRPIAQGPPLVIRLLRLTL